MLFFLICDRRQVPQSRMETDAVVVGDIIQHLAFRLFSRMKSTGSQSFGFRKVGDVVNLLPEFCTRNLKVSRYHLGTLAIMGVTTPTQKSRRYPDGKIQEIKFPEKPQP
jgi:hypothetical protein